MQPLTLMRWVQCAAVFFTLSIAANVSAQHSTATYITGGTLFDVEAHTELNGPGWGSCQWIGSGYYCAGMAYTAARVDTRLYAPGSWLVHSTQAIDDPYAEVSFSYDAPSIAPPWWGVWYAESDHYVKVKQYQHLCSDDMDPLGLDCHCPGGFPYPCGSSDYWQWQGQTSDTVFVDEPPPPPPPPGIVDVEYTMFIPLNHVAMPLPFAQVFAGDSQYSYTPGTSEYRIQQKFSVNTSAKTVQVTNHGTGITHGWTPYWDHMTASGSCFRKDCPNCPQYITGQLIVHDGQCIDLSHAPFCSLPSNDMSSMSVAVAASTVTSVTVTFNGDPGNDCLISSFDISWLNTLEIAWDGGTPRYELDVNHDGFPLHEIRINGELVYSFDPISAGTTPNNLAWPKDIQDYASGSLP